MCQSEDSKKKAEVGELLDRLLDPDLIRENYSAIFDKSSDVYNDLEFWTSMTELYRYMVELCDYRRKKLKDIVEWN